MRCLLSVITGNCNTPHPIIRGCFPLYMNVGSGGSSSAGKQQQNIHNISSSTEPDYPDDPLEWNVDEFNEAVSSLNGDDSDEDVSEI